MMDIADPKWFIATTPKLAQAKLKVAIGTVPSKRGPERKKQ